MRAYEAGAVAGLIGGAVMSLAMWLGRRAGLLEKTLAEDTEDWLDRHFHTRAAIGDRGTTALELGNHLAGSAGFGLGYEALRPALGGTPPVLAGALYGAGLYALAIGGVAPLLGITQGEQNAPAPVVAQRLGMHILYGVVTALAFEGLSRRHH